MMMIAASVAIPTGCFFLSGTPYLAVRNSEIGFGVAMPILMALGRSMASD